MKRQQKKEDRMNKRDFAGWKEVFKFSFFQGVKSKSYIGVLLVLSLLVLCIVPIFGWIQNKDNEVLDSTSIESLYVYDNSGFDIDYSKFAEDSRYSTVKIDKSSPVSFEDRKNELKDKDTVNDVLVEIEYDIYSGFSMTFVKAAGAEMESNDYDTFTDDFAAFFEGAKNQAIDISEEQFKFISKTVTTEIKYVNVNENGDVSIDSEIEKKGISMDEYSIMMWVTIATMLLISMSGGQIVNSVVTEKSTKVVEYLMINVRPLALITGKILSSLLLVIVQLLAIGIAYFAGSSISASMFESAQAGEKTGAVQMFFDMIESISAGELLLALMLILVGVLFFSILAGLAGASVSKLEEVQEGMKVFQLLTIVGCYSAIIMGVMQSTSGVSEEVFTGLCIFPVTAPFVVPTYLLFGKVSVMVGIISLIVLAIATMALFVFTSKVYESMIFYNGKPLKVKDILQIAKNRSIAGKGDK